MIGAGGHDEVVFELPIGAVEHDVDAGIGLVIPHPAVGWDADLPLFPGRSLRR